MKLLFQKIILHICISVVFDNLCFTW